MSAMLCNSLCGCSQLFIGECLPFFSGQTLSFFDRKDLMV
ncbi:hypothetical protein PORCRE_66 [Porphyromonas crevioricanis JCM 15906]|uniref:Uncharacterized protein n=1 Tax=Porphyromonas crevioricanis JCM 15906 TaxID=1305617 RepID=S4NFN7_9PORP|nr:hypothetical protein PORCRE_66 [Porphyromonas crevioricanis JCM 15906]GAD07805.1 hypothetical protein PORCAN_1433 [Porphyromonas crevioricanis JCM 13913]